MAAKQQGQILYLGSTGSKNGPGGSLSTRFQKLAQARNSGITIVNQPVAGADPVGGRGLGLGYKTGTSPSGLTGQRIITNNKRGGTGIEAGAGVKGLSLTASGKGLHTPGGLARAMQERGTGVTDEFLLAPAVALGGSPGHEGRNGKKGGPVSRNIKGTSNHPNHTQSNRHKAMVLGNRPGRKQSGKSSSTSSSSSSPQLQSNKKENGLQQQKQKQKGANASKATAKGAGKAKGAKPGKPDVKSLDSELDSYMMANSHTAASLLDNDLDSYMAERSEDASW